MERRALIALALSFVVFMAFMYFGEKTETPVAPAPATQTAAAPRPRLRPRPEAGSGSRASAPRRCGRQPSRPAKDVVVDTPLFRAVFTELGGRLKSFH